MKFTSRTVPTRPGTRRDDADVTSTTDQQTALITGASSGIGKALAALLVEGGYRVLGTTRDPSSVSDPIAGVTYLALDLTDEASITACAQAAGPVDVLINNAGESQSGPLEEIPREALERLFQLNVIGQIRLTQEVLPGMRERRRGRIIMVGSMLASFPLAYRSSYVASKAAIKGFAHSLRGEVAQFGIGVATIEPGSINTGISERRTEYVDSSSPYIKGYRTMLEHLNANESSGISAERVAQEVLSAVEARKPKALYAVGSNAPFVFALRRLAPTELVHAMVARKHGLS